MSCLTLVQVLQCDLLSVSSDQITNRSKILRIWGSVAGNNDKPVHSVIDGRYFKFLLWLKLGIRWALSDIQYSVFVFAWFLMDYVFLWCISLGYTYQLTDVLAVKPLVQPMHHTMLNYSQNLFTLC